MTSTARTVETLIVEAQIKAEKARINDIANAYADAAEAVLMDTFDDHEEAERAALSFLCRKAASVHPCNRLRAKEDLIITTSRTFDAFVMGLDDYDRKAS